MPQHSKFEPMAEIYGVLANSKRLMILNALAGKELSVDELTKKLKLRKPNVSQHLTILRYAKLVSMRRDATNVFYKITEPKLLKNYIILQNSAWKTRLS